MYSCFHIFNFLIFLIWKRKGNEKKQTCKKNVKLGEFKLSHRFYSNIVRLASCFVPRSSLVTGFRFYETNVGKVSYLCGINLKKTDMSNILQYITWNVDPQIIKGISLGYYNFLFVGGIILCACIIHKIFEKEKIPDSNYSKLFYYVLGGIVLGARLGHCLFYEPAYYLQHPLEMILPFGFEDGRFVITGYRGLASHGGVLGMLIAISLYSRNTKTDFLKTLDYIAIVAPLGSSFIRFGNLMNSEITGKATDVPWAFIFERIDSVPRHPAQLYEAIAYLIIFAAVMILYSGKRVKPGSGFLFGFTVSSIFIFRFFIEFLKERQVDFEAGMFLDMGQLLSIPLIIVGLFFVLRRKRHLDSQSHRNP
jgi:prolipoprotein diacylglyceryl transferase